jgi:hypothetical protein
MACQQPAPIAFVQQELVVEHEQLAESRLQVLL